MRCLIVTSIFPPVMGGSATVYDSLARHGQGRVVVMAPRVNYLNGQKIPGAAAYDATCGFKVYRVRQLRTAILQAPPNILQRAWVAGKELVLRARVVLAIARTMKAEGITTLCIGELVSNGWLAGIARHWLGLFTIIYVHGEEVSIANAYDRNATRRRRALAAAGRVITVSRFSKQVLIDRMGVPAERITLIPNGVDLSRFSTRPRNPELTERYGLAGRRVLISVGRLVARKGIDRVIACLPALCGDYPDLVYLVVGDGEERDALERQVAELGLSDKVMFAGAVPDDELPDHYVLGDVFILPHGIMPNGDTEGFGIVFLEANACGVPVIAGSAGGSADAVQDGDNGLMIDGQDLAAIDAAVRRLLDDAALRDRLRKGGLYAASQSDWGNRARRFLDACEGGHS
jgi:phosphatidylinositol alpha-1,6-mannosyltransferase